MINRNNKKGFTIVELVIVIAVIAILAAVLIPTFAGIIAKANESADIKAVREMNTALTAEFAVEKPDEGDMEAVINALEKNGFNSLDSIKPISKDYKFVWSYVDCCIILLNADDEIVFPAAETLKFQLNETNIENNNLSGGVKYVDAVVKDAAELVEAIANGQMEIKLEENLDVKTPLAVPADAEIAIDLNGKTLTTDLVDAQKHAYAFNVEGTVTLKNGTVEARGIQVYSGAKVVIEDGATVKSLDNNGGACLWIYAGGEVVINGGTFNALNGLSDADYNNIEPGAVYNKGTLTIKGGTFTAMSDVYTIVNEAGATLTIEGGTFRGNRGVVCANGGTVTITGGTFEIAGEHPDPAHVVYTGSATVTVNGGTFNGSSVFCKDSNGTGSIFVKTGVTVNGTATTEDKTYN